MSRRNYLLLGLVFFFLFLELGARFAMPELRLSASSLYFDQYFQALLQPSPVLIEEGRPGAKVTLPNSAGEKVDYQLNSQGWRDEEFAPWSATANALVLGDSYSFGIGIPAQDRYSERVEQVIPGLKVWNLAGMTNAPDQNLLLAQRWLPPMSWSFLILQLSDFDLLKISRHEWKGIHSSTGIPSVLAELKQRKTPTHSVLWNLLVHLFGTKKEVSDESAILERSLSRLIFSVRETAKLARERKIPLLILQANGWGESIYGVDIAHAYRDGVAEVAKNYSAALLDLGRQDHFPLPDFNWTSVSHKNIAQLLLPEIREILFGRQGARNAKDRKIRGQQKN